MLPWLLASLAFAGPAFVERTEHFAALDTPESYTLMLPAGFSEANSRQWPVIVWLHGAGRNHRTLRDKMPGALEKIPAVLVLPNGRLSWWTGRYRAFVLELLDRLTDRHRLGANVSAGGWSMGGFGSARLVEEYPERFRAWAGLIALLDFPNPAYPREQNHAVPAGLGADENPLARADRLRGKRLRFVTARDAFDRSMNGAFHARLDELGIAHEFAIGDGGHTFDVVARELPGLLGFLAGVHR